MKTRVYDRDPHVKMAEVDMPCKINGLTIQVIPVKSESECESVRENESERENSSKLFCVSEQHDTEYMNQPFK